EGRTDSDSRPRRSRLPGSAVHLRPDAAAGHEPEDARRVLGHADDQRRVERGARDDPPRPPALDAEEAPRARADPDAAVATPHEPPDRAADRLLRDRDETLAIDAAQAVHHPDPDGALRIQRHAV